MSGGQKAADDTRKVFRDLGNASEDLRKNVNSYADNLLGGNRSHGGTDFHPDAKKAGRTLEKGVDDAGKKVDQAIKKHK